MSYWLIGYAVAVAVWMIIATVQSVFCLDASAWASWVQAIGSVVALAIAIYVPWRQGKNSEELAQREADEQRRIVDFETASVAMDVKSFLRILETVVSIQLPGDRPFVIDEIEFADLLQRITWCRQRVVTTGNELLELRHTLTEAAAIMRRYKTPALHISNYEKNRVIAYANQASDILDRILGD
ncbi:hypothetical protein [Cupriavidus campinensis]